MDLGAYAQIDDLEEIMTRNGISCPRLRGLRLMKTEEPVDFKTMQHDVELSVMQRLCETSWGQTSWYTLGWNTTQKCKYHIKNYDWYYKSEDEPGYKEPEIRWDRLKGKKKRIFVTEVKNEMRKRKEQYAVWNRYVGRDDILYIHARIGGNNWSYYYTYVVNEPWFLEKIDDAFDSTYCDIYAKIDPKL